MNKNILQLCADRFSDRKGGIPEPPCRTIISGTITGDSIMKRIPLTQGKFAIVDDEDYDWLNQWKWCVQKNHRRYYAMRGLYEDGIKIKTLRMHRVILKPIKGFETDHINHNGLDNRKSNLRLCSHQQNMQNQRGNQNTSSRFKGVTFEKNISKWRGQLRHNSKTYHLGCFDIEIDAAIAYDKKAQEVFGEYACLNL